MKETLKSKKGITLIALVITVIILIILAGISISMLVGSDGVITKAKQARQNMQNAAIEEQERLNTLYSEMDTEIAGIGSYDALDSLVKFKRTIAEAITNAGVPTSENDSAETMAGNIAQLKNNNIDKESLTEDYIFLGNQTLNMTGTTTRTWRYNYNNLNTEYFEQTSTGIKALKNFKLIVLTIGMRYCGGYFAINGEAQFSEKTIGVDQIYEYDLHEGDVFALYAGSAENVYQSFNTVLLTEKIDNSTPNENMFLCSSTLNMTGTTSKSWRYNYNNLNYKYSTYIQQSKYNNYFEQTSTGIKALKDFKLTVYTCGMRYCGGYFAINGEAQFSEKTIGVDQIYEYDIHEGDIFALYAGSAENVYQSFNTILIAN